MFKVWCYIQVQGDGKLSSQFCCIYSIRRVCADNTMHISHISLPQSNYRLSKLSITFWMYIGVCVTCIFMKTHVEVGYCMNDRHRTRNDRCRCRHNCVNFFFNAMSFCFMGSVRLRLCYLLTFWASVKESCCKHPTIIAICD